MDTKRSLDKYNRTVIDEDTGVEILLQGKSIDYALFDECGAVDLFNEYSEEVLGVDAVLNSDKDLDLSSEAFHEQQTSNWRIPEEYKQIDTEAYLLSRCNTDEERSRVAEELQLFLERDLDPLLQFLIFLVDHMRDNKYIWGVGRGSSVASYILFLIGIHKINSIQYKLDIKEFLK